MKKDKLFDFVIGNSPYQDERQGTINTTLPVYHNLALHVFYLFRAVNLQSSEFCKNPSAMFQ